MTNYSTNVNNYGTLYIVATPIGNLADITMRAVEILGAVDVILAEDTRHSRVLLTHLGISKPLQALHEHNEEQQLERCLAQLQEGKDLALISDAGTPLISDPGYRLVAYLRQQNVRVVPIPGACALIAALCASGLPSDSFCFEGFLAAKSTKRQQQLAELAHETRTVILYESSHRIVEALADMQSVFGDEREIVIARELTKQFESFYRGSPAEVLQQLQVDPKAIRGEFVVLVRGAIPVTSAEEPIKQLENTLKVLLAELPLKQAVKIAVSLTGQKKNLVYDLAVKLQ